MVRLQWKQMGLLGVLPLISCATTERTFRLQFDQDVTVLLEGNQNKLIKSGESLDVPIAPVTLTQPNHGSVVVIPVTAQPGNFKIRLPNEPQLPPPTKGPDGPSETELRSIQSRNANEVAKSIIEVQSLLAERRADEALIKIQNLREKFPDFTYLLFLEASCFVVKNELAKAQSLVEVAMKEFPNDISGAQFLKAIRSKVKTDESAKTKRKGKKE
ncbi:MAG: hypothetical protein RIR26_1744 [Pseudomonadota bacterium]